jgi:ribosomal protein L25 (general stress protein Ctc)
MEPQTIQATLRGKQSQGALTRMRKSGQTAVTFSGVGMSPVALSVATTEIEQAIRARIGDDKRVLLGFEGASHLTRLTQVDRHPISGELLTVSFQKVATD